MHIGERIRFLRKSMGLTQKEFAKKIGITQGYLTEVESGKKQPSEKVLKLISHTFGVSYEWLKYGKGEMWEKGGEEVPVWLREFMKEASDEDIELVHAFIQLLKHATSKEDKELLKLFLKKVASQEGKKGGS